MMNEYKISIIIPVYHVEEYILPCLQSVSNQTMTDGVECIIVDDCGGDESITIAEEYCRNYHGNIHFSIFYRKKNGGLSAARNSGIEQAHGNYLYFLDSDDEITPDCIAVMYSYIEKYGEVDLVQGSFYENEQERLTNSPYSLSDYSSDRRIIKKFLLRYEGDIVGAQSRLIRKDFLLRHKLFFKEGIIHEDNHWTFFLAKHVKTMAFCPQRTYYHRYNPNSITGNVNVAKESIAYKTIIEDASSHIDPYLAGHQKELILNTLITAINGRYYASESDKDLLIQRFANHNSQIEKRLLYIYFAISGGMIKTKILHLLIRLYKLAD